MKRILAVFLIALLFSGCTDYPADTDLPEQPDETLQTDDDISNDKFGIAYVPEEIMHPLKTHNKLNLELFGLIYDGLFELDESFVARPVLCESYYNNGDTYYFTIRQNILFGDGTRLTAKDVEYSFKLAGKEESFFAERLKIIKSVTAVDDLSIEIRLNSPNGRLPQLLDFPIVKSKSEGESFPAGTGWFLVLQDENGFYLEAGDNRWRKETLPYERIELFPVDNVDELIYNFESMNIDIVTMDSTGIAPIRFRGEYETRNYGTTVMQYIGFNMKRELFSNSLVRQAFSCLIDRAGAAVQDFAGLAEPALLPLHPRNPAYSAEYAESIGYSLENAKSLLAAANITDTDSNGKLDYGGRGNIPVTVTILVNQDSKSKTAVCHRIASALNRIGITAEVREEKWEDYLKALNNRDFDMYYAEVNLFSDFIIDSLIKRSGSLNFGGFYSAELEETAISFNGRSLEEGDQGVKSFYSDFALQVPFIPVLFKRYTVVTHRGFFEKVTPTEHNTFYEFYNWE